jgi:GNAT superfamily N-acetyltransferase
MEIREAVAEDELDILMMVKMFLRETDYPFKFDLNKTQENFEAVLSNPNATIFVADVDGELVGCLVCVVSQPLFSSDVVANELAWYISPDQRNGKAAFKLLKVYEDWAKDMGATSVVMSDTSTKDLTKLFSRKGYRNIERSYIKEI